MKNVFLNSKGGVRKYIIFNNIRLRLVYVPMKKIVKIYYKYVENDNFDILLTIEDRTCIDDYDYMIYSISYSLKEMKEYIIGEIYFDEKLFI